MIHLGSMVRDSITGFRGIATARTQFLHAATTVCVTANRLANDVPIAAQWFEETRLVIESETQAGHFV